MTKQASKAKKKSWLQRQDDRIASGFERILLYEFDLLEEHRSFMERHFTVSLTKFEKRFEEDVAAVTDPEDRAAYEGHLAEQYKILAEDLPRLQWNAQFLVVYSTFENALNELCRMVERKSGLSLSFKDIAGQGITRASDYLIKLSDVKTPFQSTQWHRAHLLGEIRNAIAHRNGRIDADFHKQSSLAYRIQKLDGLVLKKLFKDQEDADIHLTPRFLLEAIRTLRVVLFDVANYKLYADKSKDAD